MFKRLLLISVLVLLCGRARTQQNCIPVYTTSEAGLAYQAGEQAEYMLRYTFGIVNTDIARATVALDTTRIDGVKVFHCKVFGQTAGIYRYLFNVREDFQSWFSCDGVKPVRFFRDTYECGYKSRNDYSYVWNTDAPYIDATIYNTSIDSTRILQIPLTSCTFDLPSLYYFARNIDMSRIEVDVKYPMTFAIDERSYNVYYIYKGKESLDVKGLGRTDCLHFQAKLIAGQVFNGDKDMDIYVSDDLNRVPLYFSAQIAKGVASGRLLSSSGLKYPKTWEEKCRK